MKVEYAHEEHVGGEKKVSQDDLDLQMLRDKLPVELISKFAEDARLGRILAIRSKAETLLESEADEDLRSFALILSELARSYDHDGIESLLNEMRGVDNGTEKHTLIGG